MEIIGQATVNAKRALVFAALNDIEVLRKAIPGCEEIAKESYNEFSGTVMAKVGPIKSRFVGKASLENVLPPESYTIVGEGKGGPAGTVKVTANVKLTDEGSSTTIAYEVEARIGGKLAQLGGPIVKKTAEKLSLAFFDNFQTLLDDTAPEPSAVQPINLHFLLANKWIYLVITLVGLGLAAYLLF